MLVHPDMVYVKMRRNYSLLNTIVKTQRYAYKKRPGCLQKYKNPQLQRQMSRFRKVRLQNTPPGNKRVLFKLPGKETNDFTQEIIKHTNMYLEIILIHKKIVWFEICFPLIFSSR